MARTAAVSLSALLGAAVMLGSSGITHALDDAADQGDRGLSPSHYNSGQHQGHPYHHQQQYHPPTHGHHTTGGHHVSGRPQSGYVHGSHGGGGGGHHHHHYHAPVPQHHHHYYYGRPHYGSRRGRHSHHHHGPGVAVLTRRGRVSPARPVSVWCSPPEKESLFVVDLCECEGDECEDEDDCGQFVANLGDEIPCILNEEERGCDFELVVPEEARMDDSTGRQFRIRVTDANDDTYLECSPAIEVATEAEEEEEEEEEMSPCLAENVPLTTSDDETGRNDDGTDCEWVGSSSDDVLVDDAYDCDNPVGPEKQCGGEDYEGSTCCEDGFVCMEMGVDYYECCSEGLAKHGGNPDPVDPTPAPVDPTPSPVPASPTPAPRRPFGV